MTAPRFMDVPIRGIDAVPPADRFDAPSYGLTPARIAALKEAGFNTLRLWPSLPEFLGGRDLAWTTRKWLNFTHCAADAGFKVILCFGGDGPAQRRACDGADGTRAFQLALAALAAGLAAEFMSEMVAVEFLNEPPPELAKLAAALARSVHTAAPNVTVMVQGEGGWSENLPLFDPAAFSENTAFAFHFYNNALFTHQGAAYRYVDRIPFPTAGAAETPDAMLKRALDRVAADTKLTAAQRAEQETYYRLNIPAVFWDKSPDGAGWFKWPKLDAWAKASGLEPQRIICTEFGVTGDFNFTGLKGADEVSRARWLKAARTYLERAGFGWVAHQAMGDFNLFEQTGVHQHGSKLIPSLVAALFEPR